MAPLIEMLCLWFSSTCGSESQINDLKYADSLGRKFTLNTVPPYIAIVLSIFHQSVLPVPVALVSGTHKSRDLLTYGAEPFLRSH
jgi:hypothetical protein